MDSTSGTDSAPKDLKRTLAEEHASVLAGMTPQTIVITREGETPVEWLAVGDEVLTRDRGFQPIVWINRTKLDRSDLRIARELAPVTIKAGLLAPNTPETDITVSPRQLILVSSPRAELEYASHEVLVPAAAFADQADPDEMRWDTRVSYAQILLASHHTLVADRLWLGSLFTGTLAIGLSSNDCPLVAKLQAPHMRACRPILSEDEGRTLMHDIWADRARHEQSGNEETSKVG